MTAPPPTTGRPWRLWWLAALLSAIWAGAALAHVIERDGPPPGTKGLALARRVAKDLVRENPDRLAGWRPFDGLVPGGGAAPSRASDGESEGDDTPAGARTPNALATSHRAIALQKSLAFRLVGEKPPEVQPALEALLVAWLLDLDEGRRSWAERGPEPLDPDLVAAVEKALQLR